MKPSYTSPTASESSRGLKISSPQNNYIHKIFNSWKATGTNITARIKAVVITIYLQRSSMIRYLSIEWKMAEVITIMKTDRL